MKHNLTYSVETGVSHTGLGVLWPVRLNHGTCGCGAVEMSSIVAYFTSKETADGFVRMMHNYQRLSV